jgi:hypothetical protein
MVHGVNNPLASRPIPSKFVRYNRLITRVNSPMYDVFEAKARRSMRKAMKGREEGMESFAFPNNQTTFLFYKIYIYNNLIFKFETGHEAKDDALLCLSLDHVKSCTFQMKYSFEEIGLAVGLTWLGLISKLAPMRSTTSNLMTNKNLFRLPYLRGSFGTK